MEAADNSYRPITLYRVQKRFARCPVMAMLQEQLTPAPGIEDKRMPEIVKGGVSHAGVAVHPPRRMRNAGNMVARVHLLRVRLTGISCGRVSEHPMDSARIL
jgi:hypothetical protein